VRQRLEIVILRRPGLAVYPILIARDADTPPGLHGEELTRIVRSLRGRPPDPLS
jgi:hypothetical protein